MENSLQPPAGYRELLQELKGRIRSAQVRAALAVSRELVLLYWSIGRDILLRQQAEGWGAKVVDRLARDLQAEFPGVEGYSPRSLKYMKALAEAWPEKAIVQQVAAQLPWGHHMVLLDRVKDPTQREWYLRAAVEHGWSRNILVLQIESELHAREGRALHNFARTLPPPGSDLAGQILKDPYNSTSSPSPRTRASGRLNRGCCFTCAICCSSLAAVLLSSAARCRSRSARIPSTSTCSSTTCGCTAIS